MQKLNLYKLLLQSGRWAEAGALAEAAMLAAPKEYVWPLLAAQAYTLADDCPKAFALLRAIQPGTGLPSAHFPEKAELAEAWRNLGLKAFLRQEHALASQALAEALTAQPEGTGQAEISLYLALSLQQLDRPQEALPYYQKALRLDPGNQNLLYNAVQCLNQMSLWSQAEELLSHWLQQNALASLGQAGLSLELALAYASFYGEQGQTDKALTWLEKVRQWPQLLETAEQEQRILFLCAEATLRHASGNTPKALDLFQEAARLAPESKEIFNNINNLLLSMDRRDEAAKLRRETGNITSTEQLFWQIKEAFTIPAVLREQKEAHELRQGIRNAISQTERNGLITENPLALLPKPPFYLAFHGKDDRELLQDMAAFMLRHTPVCPKAEQDGSTNLTSEPHARIKQKKQAVQRKAAGLREPARRRVGFISAYACNHTIMAYFFRVITGLCALRRPPESRPFLISFAQPENPYWAALSQAATPLIIPKNLDKAAAQIKALDLDVLVHLDLGLSPLTWLLAFRRLATLQCALYGHPVTTGIPNIDIFISPDFMEPPQAEEHYSELLHRLPGLLSGYSAPEAPQMPLRQTVHARRKNSFYLCAQSLFKVQPDFDGVIRDILSSDKDARFLFFNSRQSWETHALQNRLRATLGKLAKRIHWLRQRSEQEFYHTLAQADAVLDTTHFTGGSTSFKALGLGIPVLTTEGPFMRSRQTAALYNYMGMQGCVAASLPELPNLALNLAHSPAKRHQLSLEIFNRSPALFTAEPAARVLHDYLYGTSFI